MKPLAALSVKILDSAPDSAPTHWFRTSPLCWNRAGQLGRLVADCGGDPVRPAPVRPHPAEPAERPANAAADRAAAGRAPSRRARAAARRCRLRPGTASRSSSAGGERGCGRRPHLRARRFRSRRRSSSNGGSSFAPGALNGAGASPARLGTRAMQFDRGRAEPVSSRHALGGLTEYCDVPHQV